MILTVVEQTEDEMLCTEISDEALEMAADVGSRPEHTWTFTPTGCCSP
jgi:hypothetical protein